MAQKIKKKAEFSLEEYIKQTLPFVFEDNQLNIEKLKNILSGKIVEKTDDRFYFNWAGKDQIFQSIQAPAYTSLKPDKELSDNFDETKNVLIVGENLETLKLLNDAYFGKIKAIYIDPPYNADKNFIYKDDFSIPFKEYLEKTGQISTDKKKLTTNTESSGRHHSDWLNFMYSRIFLARNLLKKNGVIFISINDIEMHHLRMIMDEIFGSNNFVSVLKWKRKKQPSFLHGNVASIMEYILVYAKDKGELEKLSIEKRSDENTRLDNRTNKMSQRTFPPGVRVKLPPTVTTIKKGVYKIKSMEVEYLNDVGILEGRTTNEMTLTARFRDVQERINNFVDQDLAFITENYGLRRDLSEEEKNKEKMITDLLLDWGQNQDATEELRDVFGTDVFDNPKPTLLIKNLLRSLNLEEDDIILDFFAGSGTTGDAVYQLIKELAIPLRYILIQLDEAIDGSTDTGKNALALGFKTIADICIERLKRVAEKYKQEKRGDYGRKIFLLTPSNFNFKDEFLLEKDASMEALKEQYLNYLGMFVNQPTLAGADPLHVVYEIALKNGFSLYCALVLEKIKDNEFYVVKDEMNLNHTAICLDAKISNDTVEELRNENNRNKTFVFYDNALSDSQKINLNTFVNLQVI